MKFLGKIKIKCRSGNGKLLIDLHRPYGLKEKGLYAVNFYSNVPHPASVMTLVNTLSHCKTLAFKILIEVMVSMHFYTYPTSSYSGCISVRFTVADKIVAIQELDVGYENILLFFPCSPPFLNGRTYNSIVSFTGTNFKPKCILQI